ncbi:MAG: OB-fold nucleic acid binding domain-containing protein, partial [Desulfotomaculaceae bacterium]|nr:OB-fold nucleic acid binding domain-containing protein [Desulfotomaculaceae bacterium]
IQIREREGNFKDYTDFCRRLDTKAINKRVLESLIKCGAFDSLGHRRAQLMAAVDTGLGLAQQCQRDRENGQLSLLDLFGDSATFAAGIDLPQVAEFAPDQLLMLEKEALGLYISGHPLSQYRADLGRLATVSVAELADLPDDSNVVLGGLITGVKQINTRKGDLMAFLTLEDLTGTVEVVVFPRTYQSYRSAIVVDGVVLLKGRISGNDEAVKVIGEEISFLERHLGGEVHIKIDSASSPLLDQVQIILSSFKGEAPVFFHFEREGIVYKTGSEFWVELAGPVIKRLTDLLGQSKIEIKRLPAASRAQGDKTYRQKVPNAGAALSVNEEFIQKKNRFFSILEL